MRFVVALLIALGTTDAAQACGPVQHSIERNAQARVWVADGLVLGCHAKHPAPIRLGRRARVREVRLAGAHAGVITRHVIAIHDLRRGRIEGIHRIRGTLTRLIMDRTGVAAFAERRPSGVVAVRSSVDGTVAIGRAVDPDTLGLARELIAYRYEDTYQLAHVAVDGPQVAAARTLIRVGRLRIEAKPRRWSPSLLVAVRGRARRVLDPAIDPCISPSGCGGVESLQIRGPFVATRIRGENPDYGWGSVTVRSVDGGPGRRYCSGRGAIGGFVLTGAGGLACAFTAYDPDHPSTPVPEIRVGREVLARATGIDIRSLRRRGGELVWSEDGAERTAPLP